MIFKDECDAHMYFMDEYPESFCFGKDSANVAFEEWLTDWTIELPDGRLKLIEE